MNGYGDTARGDSRRASRGTVQLLEHLGRQASLRIIASASSSGRAPLTARFLTVPFTARSPVVPPGKQSGRTTNASVVKARRSGTTPAPAGRTTEGQRTGRVCGTTPEHAQLLNGLRVCYGTGCHRSDPTNSDGPGMSSTGEPTRWCGDLAEAVCILADHLAGAGGFDDAAGCVGCSFPVRRFGERLLDTWIARQ